MVFIATSLWIWGMMGQARVEGLNRLILSVFGGLLLMYLFFYALARIEMSFNEIPTQAYIAIPIGFLVFIGVRVYSRMNRPPPPFHP